MFDYAGMSEILFINKMQKEKSKQTNALDRDMKVFRFLAAYYAMPD